MDIKRHLRAIATLNSISKNNFREKTIREFYSQMYARIPLEFFKSLYLKKINDTIEGYKCDTLLKY